MLPETASPNPDEEKKKIVSWVQLAEFPNDAKFILDAIHGLSSDPGDDLHTRRRRQEILNKLSSKTPEQLVAVETFMQNFLDHPQPSRAQDEAFSRTDIPPGEAPI